MSIHHECRFRDFFVDRERTFPLYNKLCPAHYRKLNIDQIAELQYLSTALAPLDLGCRSLPHSLPNLFKPNTNFTTMGIQLRIVNTIENSITEERPPHPGFEYTTPKDSFSHERPPEDKAPRF
jgi:hypothetical protein